MSSSPIHVRHAPPFLTAQDLGRPGCRALGVPAGGAMDPWSLRTANVLAGNDEGAAALEWAGGGGTVRFDCTATIALAGAEVEAWVGGRPVPTLTTLVVAAGEELHVERFRSGRFLYLAVGGGIAVPEVLGGRGTYLPAHFGGLAGRLLATGDALPIGPRPSPAPAAGFTVPSGLAPPRAADDAPLRILPGPQADLLPGEGWATLLGSTFRVSHTGDRTGYRLDGPPLTLSATPALPSEPGCPGALQLPPGGRLIALLADAPTIGGYPKPAVVCSADLGRLAQMTPGTEFRFALTTVDEGQKLYRRARIRVDTLRELRRRA